MSTSRFFFLAVALAFWAFPVVQAQVVFDDFNDDEFSNTFQFSENGGAGVGLGSTDGPDSSPALRADIDPSATGSFAGFGFTQPGGGTFDASGQEYFSFYIRPNIAAGNLPLTLELNLQEDPGNDGYDSFVDDEYQATFVVDLSIDDCWKLIQIPLAAFADDNSVNPGSDDGFDFSNVLTFVVAIGGPAGTAYSLDFDDITFAPSAPDLVQEVVLNNFEADPTLSVFTFSETNMGIGVGTAAGAPGASGSTQAVSVGLNPAETGSFAGFVITSPSGGTVATSVNDYIGFYLRPVVNATNTPLVLELNLHEDVNMNGAYDGSTEDEYQATYLIETGDAGAWQFVAIPLAAFADDNSVFAGSDDGFDFNKLFEVVVAIGLPSGDEFQIEVDDMFFGEVEEDLDPFTLDASPESQTVNAPGTANFTYIVCNNTSNPVSGVIYFEAFLGNNSVAGPGVVQSGSLPAMTCSPTLGFSLGVPGAAPTATYSVEISAGPNTSASVATDAVNVTVTSGGRAAGTSTEWTLVDADPWPTFEAAARTSEVAAYPNPFVERTEIAFSLEESAKVQLVVYDVRGRAVATLVDGTLEAGQQSVTFDGASLPSGVYIYRLVSGTQVETGRITLVR